MEIIEKLLCIIASCLLFYFAYYLLKRNRGKALIALTLVLAMVSLLSSQTWFRGVFKTHIISIVYSTLKQYGEKLDEFQETTGKMQSEISAQQAALKDVQKEILQQQSSVSNQYAEVVRMQFQVAEAQTNLAVQQKRIEDVEFLVANLFSKTTTETIRVSETNRVFIQKLSTGAARVWLLLNACAIPRSVNGIHWGGGRFGQSPLLIHGSLDNVVTLNFVDGDLGEMKFSLTYVTDSRNTNRVTEVSFTGDEALVNGIPIRFQ